MFHHTRNFVLPLAFAIATGVFIDAAQASRLSYVSSTGSDANACTLAAPCRTLTHAIAATTLGGEVHVIDSAGYGASIAIGKSITVSGDGATVFAGPITINSAAAVVTLRDLVLNGGGSSGNGVTVQAANTVHIERCTIHGFRNFSGVQIESGNADVFVIDSTVRDNGTGLFVSTGAAARLTVESSHFDANANNGLTVLSGEAVVNRSSASNNGNDGILVFADVTLESSVIRGDDVGFLVTGGGILRVSNSVVTRNSFGIDNNGGAVLTRQNNTVSGNGTDVIGALTPLGGV
jgi:hypothetical protein